MSNSYKFNDCIKILADRRVADLDQKHKNAIIDKTQKGDKAPRGLVIELDLTHSARRINNRLYSYTGQRDGISSLVEPTPRPILKNHDDSDVDNCIGRFIGGSYVDLVPHIGSFFRDLRSLQAFQQDYLSDDPEKMYDAMERNGLLTNPKFPGLGTMRAKLRITDKEAIEKFLDERYLNFSASHASDRYTCSVCHQDWISDGPCEHRPGRMYDGKFCVNITGVWKVKEGSVVVNGADDLAYPRSMSISDAVGLPEFVSDPDYWQIDKTSIFMTDSTIQDMELDMTVKPEVLDPRDYTRKLVEGTEEEAIKEHTDALMGETVFETTYLIRIHDSLHHAYDWELRFRREDEDMCLPSDVFKLHACLHDLANEKDFRGSIINGILDGFDAEGAESDEYKVKKAASDSKEGADDGETKEILDAGSDPAGKGASAKVEDKDPDTGNKAEDSDVDPKLVDALYELLKDRLEAQQKPAELKTFEPAVDEELQKDYAEALRQVQELKDRLNSVLEYVSDDKSKVFSEDCENKLEEMWDWFGTIGSEDNSILDNVNKVDNPSEAGASVKSEDSGEKDPEKKDASTLSRFDRKVFDQFHNLKDSQGEAAAEAYLNSVLKYVPRGFHPSNYKLSEGE